MMSGSTILGIRHHGPGSARSVLKALAELQPDLILVEGPPDAQSVLSLAADADMKPPVAMLLYDPTEPRRAAYYPFAEFSPEWQAIRYGLHNEIPVRLMDLPQAIRIGLEVQAEEETAKAEKAATEEQVEAAQLQEATETLDEGASDTAPDDTETIENSECNKYSDKDDAGDDARVEDDEDWVEDELLLPDIRHDPLHWVAQAAGYGDGERWWEHLVEQRQDSGELFEAILELMTALRDEADKPSAEHSNSHEADAPSSAEIMENRREAAMRNQLRAAKKEGFERIAVVCGAWHAPALMNLPTARVDNAQLKGLPKRKLTATWVPWTHGRLTYSSGYGAGVTAPGFYQHLWDSDGEPTIHWMARIAQLLREHDLSASTASVIEATRLAEALAALRDRPQPTMDELNEAAHAVLCQGETALLQLIEEKLMIGERLGEVPERTPLLPLQQDLQRLQKRLRLKPEAGRRSLEFDLRKPNDLERSQLLHRLRLLGVYWGTPKHTSGKGTFKEGWQLHWKPELTVAVIEANLWGNTVLAAATSRACRLANESDQLSALTELVEQILWAELPDAIGTVMERLQNIAALTSDIPHLMESLPPLVRILRYGNVRQTDVGVVKHVVDGLIARIAIGLPAACSSLDDEAAQAIFVHIQAMQNATGLLQDAEQTAIWQGALTRLIDQADLHGLIAGYACRLLFEQQGLSPEETTRRMGLALSTASEPAQAAAWLEGFLHGSGLLLLHNDVLWEIVDTWITGLNAEAFMVLVPLLRRTFSHYSAPERRQLGERVKQDHAASRTPTAADRDIQVERANLVLPTLARLLGIT